MKLRSLFPLLLVGLLACQPSQDNPAPEEPGAVTDPAPAGTPTPVGSPVGSLTTFRVGPAGGSFTTADGHTSLRIPAGALTKETSVTIQPIENQAFGGAGAAYRILAAEGTLAKEATLVMLDATEELLNSLPEAVAIASQDTKQVWQGRLDTQVEINKAQKTVSAKINHLGDWAFYEQFYIKVNGPTILAPLEQTELQVYYQLGRFETAASELDGLLVPLTPHQLMPASSVVRWAANGQSAGGDGRGPYGTVVPSLENKYAKATYYAPTMEPEGPANPVAVSAEIDLKQHGRLILSKAVRIESASFLKIGGQSENNPNVMLTIQGNRLMGTLTDKTHQQLQLNFIIDNFKGKGAYPINKEHSVVMTAALLGRVPYSDSYYEDNGEWISGGGTITISEYDAKQLKLVGTVAGGFFDGYKGKISASGKFKGAAVRIP